ncbi:hypothetical protein [Kribbia dieselivorans]|uniref:hypothetical protein n=1 Tax=Kribbia dieselivorans TaxID=331526 RepID=UPI000837CDA5|nr:hypothetical protein [Kribbia dieselivorans]
MKVLQHLSYANVASTLALVVAVGGGGVALAATLPNNSVGSAQVKNNSLIGADIKDNTLTGADVKDSSLTGTDIKNGSLTGSDVKSRSLNGSKIALNTITSKNLSSAPHGFVRGYVWNDQPSSPVGTTVAIGSGYAFNSSGGPITSVRNGTGNYTVTFAGLNFYPGNVQVSGYGTYGLRCNVGSWGTSVVNVLCSNAAGAPTDSYFSLAVIK